MNLKVSNFINRCILNVFTAFIFWALGTKIKEDLSKQYFFKKFLEEYLKTFSTRYETNLMKILWYEA